MKKNYTYLLMSFLVVGLLSSNASAQGAYVNVGAGFGFGDGSMSGSNSVSTNDGNTQTAVFGSLGSGLNVGAGFGFMFNENFGAELGVNYLIGSEYTNTFDGTTTTSGSGGGASITTNSGGTYSMSANLLRINPSLVVMGGGDKIKPYAKFGVMLGFGTATVSESFTSSSTDGTTTTSSEGMSTSELSGGIGFGFSGALGASYSLNDKMSLFAEMNMNNMSWAAMSGIRLTDTSTDTDPSGTTTTNNLDGATTFELQTNYVDEITPTSNTFANPNVLETSPRDELKEKVGVGSVGINIGLKISF
ncbi:outer membrane beta-barrel protein [Flavobacteriales bacterium]|nr:outer membrane beta-barrel protein [Flavobacteriales bacterium]MDC3337089.1 outer membrane beta-barrel protein [Flavobacteriales bacterium]